MRKEISLLYHMLSRAEAAWLGLAVCQPGLEETARKKLGALADLRYNSWHILHCRLAELPPDAKDALSFVVL